MPEHSIVLLLAILVVTGNSNDSTTTPLLCKVARIAVGLNREPFVAADMGFQQDGSASCAERRRQDDIFQLPSHLG